MWTELLAIAAGFVLLAWSAARFVEGASAIAWHLDIPPLIIGLTVVSIGTSAPEIVFSGIAAWQGNAGLAVGNALGSNIINTSLILGIGALIMPLYVHSSIIRRELPMLLLVMGFTYALLVDHRLGRLDGALLLTGMLAVLYWIVQCRHETPGRTRPDGQGIRTGTADRARHRSCNNTADRRSAGAAGEFEAAGMGRGIAGDDARRQRSRHRPDHCRARHQPAGAGRHHQQRAQERT